MQSNNKQQISKHRSLYLISFPQPDLTMEALFQGRLLTLPRRPIKCSLGDTVLEQIYSLLVVFFSDLICLTLESSKIRTSQCRSVLNLFLLESWKHSLKLKSWRPKTMFSQFHSRLPCVSRKVNANKTNTLAKGRLGPHVFSAPISAAPFEFLGVLGPVC